MRKRKNGTRKLAVLVMVGMTAVSLLSTGCGKKIWGKVRKQVKKIIRSHRRS